jgi:hypothetical protein
MNRVTSRSLPFRLSFGRRLRVVIAFSFSLWPAVTNTELWVFAAFAFQKLHSVAFGKRGAVLALNNISLMCRRCVCRTSVWLRLNVMDAIRYRSRMSYPVRSSIGGNKNLFYT